VHSECDVQADDCQSSDEDCGAKCECGSARNIEAGITDRTIVVPIFTLSPAALEFGNQVRGTTSPPQVVTVNNTGAAPLQITSISRGGSNPNQFTHTNETVRLAPQRSREAKAALSV